MTIELMRKTVRLTLLTAGLEDEQPLSTMISAEVEEGKTTLISPYAGMRGIGYLSDATAYGILEAYGRELISGEVHHLMIPEMIRPLERSRETAASLIAFLNELIEEGVVEIQTYAKQLRLDRPMKAGVIACMAKEPLLKKRKRWNESGFLSRFLVLSYTYDLTTADQVMQSIRRGNLAPIPPFVLPQKSKVIIPLRIEDDLEMLAQGLAHSLYIPLHGFRMFKHLRRLAKASALNEGRTVVDTNDLDYIIQLSNHINLSFNKL